jgi:hypothetical protein
MELETYKERIAMIYKKRKPMKRRIITARWASLSDFLERNKNYVAVKALGGLALVRKD